MYIFARYRFDRRDHIIILTVVYSIVYSRVLPR